MRARAAVTSVIVLAGTGVLLGAGGAQAASHSLSVAAVGRSGGAADITAHVVNVRSGREYDVRSGKAKSLPAGTYSVTAEIWSPDDSYTLGARVVSLSKNRKVTFDARKGRKVSFKIDDSTAELRTLQLVPFVKTQYFGRQWALDPMYDSVPAGRSYVIPVQHKYLSMFAYGHLERRGSTAADPSPYRVDLVRNYTGGLPADTSWGNKRSSLARITTTIRSSGAGERGDFTLAPATKSTGTLPASGVTEFGRLPARFVSYRTPGRYWRTKVRSAGPAGGGGVSAHYDELPAYKKGAHTATFRKAAWSPAFRTSIYDRWLTVTPGGGLSGPGYGGTLTAKTRTAKLYRGSTLLAQSTGKSLTVKIPTTYSWYTLKLTAHRATTDAHSARTTLTTKFKARGYNDDMSHGGARVFRAKLAPAGLDSRNTAAAGSLTSVPITFAGTGGTSSIMKYLKVEASFDGGKTWKKLSAARSGTKYTVKVRNPKTAGHVSLRVSAIDSKAGTRLWQTVRNAYGVR